MAGADGTLESSAGACAAETVAARSSAEATKYGANLLSRFTVAGLRVGFILLPGTLSRAQFSLVLDLWALALARGRLKVQKGAGGCDAAPLSCRKAQLCSDAHQFDKLVGSLGEKAAVGRESIFALENFGALLELTPEFVQVEF
jgi:hypothetical protein